MNASQEPYVLYIPVVFVPTATQTTPTATATTQSQSPETAPTTSQSRKPTTRRIDANGDRLLHLARSFGLRLQQT